MTDFRKWMDLLTEDEISDAEYDLAGIPDESEIYRKLSKEFFYYLSWYMRINWIFQDDHIKRGITKVFDAEMPVLEDSHTAYRGMSLESLEQLDEESNFLNLEIVEWNRYMSMSFDPEIAEEFIKDEDNHVQIFFTIHTKAGCRGIVTGAPEYHDVLAPSVFDEMKDQSEIILNRGSKFKILSKEYEKFKDSDGYPKIRWEVEMQQVE